MVILRYNIKTDSISISTRFNSRSDNGYYGNNKCPQYLGITVAEGVLSRIFKNVRTMPFGNPNYDFVCARDYKVDVKASCRHKCNGRSDRWLYQIRQNKIADYFLCLAFDDRINLNPEHIWLIPGHILNDNKATAIAITKIDRWKRYELDKLDDITQCCNIIRGG